MPTFFKKGRLIKSFFKKTLAATKPIPANKTIRKRIRKILKILGFSPAKELSGGGIGAEEAGGEEGDGGTGEKGPTTLTASAGEEVGGLVPEGTGDNWFWLLGFTGGAEKEF
ncbi:hypothetical protein C4578_01180 [Candidatus Microgenomates bacterium]|nr:MAG: hypothetical protein C4578_01180 [Candidatus Microgenomates bacterium]